MEIFTLLKSEKVQKFGSQADYIISLHELVEPETDTAFLETLLTMVTVVG